MLKNKIHCCQEGWKEGSLLTVLCCSCKRPNFSFYHSCQIAHQLPWICPDLHKLVQAKNLSMDEGVREVGMKYHPSWGATGDWQLLETDRERERQLSLRMCTLMSWSCFSGQSHTHEYMEGIGYYYFCQKDLNLWDEARGMLICKEAEGRIENK